jgi:DNA recombination protein RmuC
MLGSFLIFLVGATGGALIIWLLFRTKLATLGERISGKDCELDETRAGRDHYADEIRNLRSQLQDEMTRRSTAEARAGRVSELESEGDLFEQRITSLQADIVNLTSNLADSEARRQEEVRSKDEQLALLSEARTEFGLQFENLANRILEDKSKRFTEQNKINLDLLLQPLGVQIKEFREKVDQVYDNESQQRVSLRNEIELLRGLNEKMDQDAINLTNALKGQSKTLGNWGEFILEEILQKAGLTKDREYAIRETYTAPDGKRSQPDVVIMLPEGRHLIVDSKINLASYLRYCSSEDEAECKVELKKHISGVRTHLKELDVKSYQDHYKLNSLDFVLMFVPLEPAFILAVRQDVALFDDAFSKRVVIVCPSTLLATMRTVRNIWRQEQQKRNVLEIADQSGALYDKFVGFVEDLSEIGDRLRQAQQSYDAAHNKLTSGKGNLIGRAERMLQLGAKASKRLQQNLVDAATESEQPERRGTLEASAPALSPVERGLFPELVAGEVDLEDDSRDLRDS